MVSLGASLAYMKKILPEVLKGSCSEGWLAKQQELCYREALLTAEG